MTDFAIIQTGGKQYRVSPGQKIRIEKLEISEGDVNFDKVLLVNKNGRVEIGAPHVNGAVVSGRLVRNARARKIIVFKFKSKIRYRKTQGHRQNFSEVEISNI